MDVEKSISEPDVTGGIPIISYCRTRDGAYEPVSGRGWRPVDIVNRQAWEEIEKKIAASRRRVRSGRVSCLHYYMVVNQMDIGLLARYANIPGWRVLFHLVPFFFRRLRPQTLRRYADLFQVAPEDLQRGRLKAAVYDIPAHDARQADEVVPG